VAENNLYPPAHIFTGAQVIVSWISNPFAVPPWSNPSHHREVWLGYQSIKEGVTLIC